MDKTLTAWFPLIVFFVLMYAILILPQRRQQKKRQDMLASLQKGDRVVTIGGIHGVITDIKGDVLTLRIAEKVEINLQRSAVGYVAREVKAGKTNGEK